MKTFFVPNRLFWLLVLVIGIMFVMPLVASAQDGSTPLDPLQLQFAVYFTAAAVVNRFVEFFKPKVNDLKYDDDVKRALLTMIAVAAGIAVAFTGRLNIAAGYAIVPEIVGTVGTGAVFAFGADLLHVLLDLLYGGRDKLVGSTPVG